VIDGAMRVVMADDHARMRTRIRQALEAGGCVVCGEGASADDAIALTLEHAPDVALLDIHMPGNGIAAAREIARTHPGTAVVMLTASAEDDDLFDSLRAGASGYLLKDTDPDVLVDALRGVLEGEAAMSRRLVGRIMEEFRSPATPRFARRSKASARLSAREWGDGAPGGGPVHRRGRPAAVPLTHHRARPRVRGPAQAAGEGPPVRLPAPARRLTRSPGRRAG
jgi:DNA-binding NarL/FixJ family response regulator